MTRNVTTPERQVKVLAFPCTQRKTGRHAGSWAGTARVLVDGQEVRFGVTGKTQGDATAKFMRKLESLKVAPEPEPTPLPAVDLAFKARDWRDHTLPTMPRIKSPATRALYAATVERDIVADPIGSIALTDLTAHDVEVMLGRHATQSGSTRRRILTVLRFVLDAAQRDGLVTQNVARLVGRPAADKPKPKALAPGELAKVSDALTGDRLESVLTLLAWLGCRIGEVLAIAESDVDLGPEPQVFIRGSLVRVKGEGLVLTDGKTDHARRWVPLTPQAVAAIRRWRATKAAERLAAGPLWVESDFLFTSERGTSMDPQNVARRFREKAASVGVKASPHRLRHTLATDLLADGVSLREVQELLGHASPMTTAAMYQTVTPTHQRAAMDRLATIRAPKRASRRSARK